MRYHKVEISSKKSLEIYITAFNEALFIKTWEKRTVVLCTDLTTIENICTGKYPGEVLKNQICVVFHLRAFRISVSPKFIELCMETSRL